MQKPQYHFAEHWEGKKAYLIVTRDDGAEVPSRIPLHILVMPDEQKEFHMKSIVQDAYRRMDKIPYGKAISQ